MKTHKIELQAWFLKGRFGFVEDTDIAPDLTLTFQERGEGKSDELVGVCLGRPDGKKRVAMTRDEVDALFSKHFGKKNAHTWVGYKFLFLKDIFGDGKGGGEL